MNIERIRTLAAHVRTLEDTKQSDPDGFHQGWWTHVCGTPSCVAGHAVALFEGTDAKGRIEKFTEEGAVRARACALLDIDPEQGETLFDSKPYGQGAAVTAQEAAGTLDRLAETGRVVWGRRGAESLASA